MAITLRPVTDDEYAGFRRREGVSFGDVPGDTQIALERRVTDLDRTIMAMDQGRQVGSASSFAFDMTMPGGAFVPVAGVTGVTVSATHRRRGVLRAMMAHQLADARGRGDVLATLNASETPIYGRFGYGLAENYLGFRVDARRAAFHTSPPDRHPLQLLLQDEAKAVVPAVYDACRPARPGATSRPTAWWDIVLGREHYWIGGGKLFVVLSEPGRGGPDDPGGYAIYSLEDTGNGPFLRLTVVEIIAADPGTEAALWHYLIGVDLVEEVHAPKVPTDVVLRWWLADWRDLKVDNVQDYTWVRPLDVAAVLSARRYDTADEVVLEVDDPFRPEVAGTYRVSGSPDAASCERLAGTATPDLVLTAGDLGALLLGQTRARPLAQVGRVRPASPEALDRADRFFAWPVAPYCATFY